RHGRVRRAYTGISAQQAAIPRRLQLAAGLVQDGAAMIASVEPGSPADRAGLMSGDRIISLDGTRVTGADDLIRTLTGDKIGRALEVELLRITTHRRVSLVPEERPRAR